MNPVNDIYVESLLFVEHIFYSWFAFSFETVPSSLCIYGWSIVSFGLLLQSLPSSLFYPLFDHSIIPSFITLLVQDVSLPQSILPSSEDTL